jgi:hypothetical protein
MLGVDSREYTELEMRVKKFKRYEKVSRFLLDYWYVALVIGFLLENLVSLLLGHGTGITAFFVFAPIAPLLVLAYVFVKRMRKYALEPNEWVRFVSYSILNNLERYSKTKNIELKKDYRNDSLKIANYFLSHIKKRWKIGSFKLAQHHFGKPITDLKKNIEYRLIPNLKNGDDKTLDKIEEIMRYSYFASKSFNLEVINNLNERMSTKLPTTEALKVGTMYRLKDFFTAHKVIKHGLVVSVISIVSCVLFYVAFVSVGITKDYSFAGSVAVFIGLLTIYFTKLSKE